MVDAPDSSASAIGWTRAILSAVAILVVGVAVLVYGADAAIKRLTGLDRSQRVGVATAVFFLGLLLLAWLLRRLQQRHLI